MEPFPGPGGCALHSGEMDIENALRPLEGVPEAELPVPGQGSKARRWGRERVERWSLPSLQSTRRPFT